MEKKKDKNEKKGPGLVARAIISLIVATITVIYLNLKVSRYPNISDELGWVGITGWAWNVFCLAIFFSVFAFSFFLVNIKRRKERIEKEQLILTEQEKNQRRRKKLNVIFLIITILATGLYVSYNYDQLMLWGLAKSIPAVALFFGLVFMAFELFSFIKPSIFEKLVRLPWDILMKVVVPMMPFIIILLGVMQAWYPTKYPFLDETAKGIRSSFFAASSAFQKVIIQLYNLGLERPFLWFALTIGALIIMLYFVVKDIFVEEEITEEDMPMEQFLDKPMKEYEERRQEKKERQKEIDKGSPMKWYEKLNKKEKEEEKSQDIKDEKADLRVNKYKINFEKQ